MLQFPSLANETKLSIQTCESFMKDNRFEIVKKSLGEQSPNLVNDWQNLAIETTKVDSKDMNLMTEKDNIFFLDDRFELIVDVRGLTPTNIECTVTDLAIEINGTKSVKNEAPTGFVEQTQTMNRRYMLPQRIDPTKGNCFLSAEGILFVTAPWLK